jgi:hypothetical protein
VSIFGGEGEGGGEIGRWVGGKGGGWRERSNIPWLDAYLLVVFRGRSRQPRPAGLTLRVPQCYGLAPDPRDPVRLRWGSAEI